MNLQYLLFLLLYASLYMCNAVYGTFMPVYLNRLGYSSTAIGSLLALGPFIAIIAQPVWGIAGDRAKTKNFILQILLLGSGVSMMLYQFSSAFLFLAVIIAVFTFFQTSINPIGDAITLEHLEKTGWKFGPIRMAGTIGFALMAVLAGILAKQDINAIFLLYLFITLAAFFITFALPKVKGHQSSGQKITPLALFRHHDLVIYMLFSLLIQVTMSFYYTFFPIYYRQMGADNVLLGWAMFISAISEIPFLLFADRIINKLGISPTLILSGITVVMRWLLLYLFTNPYLVLPLQMFHGMQFIVVSYCLATYINREVPKELRASGQTMYGLVGIAAGRIIGNLLGGLLSDLFSIRQVFFYSAVFTFLILVVFGMMLLKTESK